MLEFTDNGFCNLNLERADGGPAEIDSVEGGLSYLIYDSHNGGSYGNLLGTTIFTTSDKLKIESGQNDELSFLMENLDGTSERVNLVIPEGHYSRPEIIQELNRQLEAKGLSGRGVVAAEYGSSSVQITGGPAITITGLKGNMFNIETEGEAFSSIFYDNICTGVSANPQDAVLSGKAYFNDNADDDNHTAPIQIDDTNNKLHIYLGNDDIEIPLANSSSCTLADIVEQMNKVFQLGNFPAKAEAVTLSDESSSLPGQYLKGGDYTFLKLTNTNSGNGLSFKVDTADPVLKKTYETLFCNTVYDGSTAPVCSEGSDPTMAVLKGAAIFNLSDSIELPSDSSELGVVINGVTYTLKDIPPGPYTREQLIGTLNQKLQDLLPADLKGQDSNGKDKVTFQFDSNKLTIASNTELISSIDVTKSGGVYEKLFKKTEFIQNIQAVTDYGTEKYTPIQGTGGVVEKEFKPAQIILDEYPIICDKITINKNQNNFFTFTLGSISNSKNYTIFIEEGTYSISQLMDKINETIASYNPPLKPQVRASVTNGCFTLTTQETGENCSHRLYLSTGRGTIWGDLIGTHPITTEPESSDLTPATPASVTSEHQFSSITIGADNDKFTFTYNNTNYEILLDHGTYDPALLKEHLETKINERFDPTGTDPVVNVTYADPDTSKGLVLTAKKAGEKKFQIVENGFYRTVLKKPVTKTVTGSPSSQSSKHTYLDPYIIGREDLVNHNVTIVKGLNDTFTLDLNYTPATGSGASAYMETLTVTFPPKEYTGTEIAAYLQEKLSEQLKSKGLQAVVKIGADHSVPIAGSNDDTALQISIKERDGNSPAGTYTLDGVRGSAAYFIFYRTTGKPEPSYITGSEDISDGVVFQPGKNELSFQLDGVPYHYTFPVGAKYTAQELLDLLNDDFENGTINGKPVRVRAELDNGNLKLIYQTYGPHTITNIDGGAKGTVFFHEEERKSLDPYMLQVGSLGHQGLELTRLRVNTASLGINSVTISRVKYAEKALDRLDRAIDLLSSRRSLYGALQNRIEFLTANNQNTSQNLQASESRIRDANMAKQAVDHVKNKITTQASESVLAQANQLPNRIADLLFQ